MKSRFLPFLFIIVCIVCAPLKLEAAESDWIKADHMQVRLIAAKNAENTTDLALQVKMDAGWHSYWRSPGEAGLPYRFNWDGTQNAKNFEISWPTPKRFVEFGLRTFGYDGNIVFPIAYEQDDPKQDSQIILRLATMACKDICIPQNFHIEFDLPATEKATTANATLIQFGKRKTPHIGDTDTLKISSVITSPDALIINAYAKNGFNGADILVEMPEQLLLTEMEIEPDKTDPKRAMIKFLAPEDVENLTAHLSGQNIVITLVSGKDAIEKSFGL